jgi:pimeloyl-ACP methyl ester carboxylesterase
MWIEVQGRRAYAYTGGKPFDAALPVVVFVHGAQNDHSVWILQSRYLAHHGFSVLAVDLPGHGRSQGPAHPSIEAMAQWLRDFLDAAGVSAATVVGHSMGSLIGLEFSALAGKRLNRLVLLGTAFPMRVSDQLLQAARSDEAAALDMINAWSHLSLNHQPGCPGPGFSVFMQARRLMERQAPGVLFNDFNACNAYAAGLERARALAAPALVIAGRRDLMTPAKAARALAREIPDCKLVEIDGSGHSLMTERPDAVLLALKDYLLTRA